MILYILVLNAGNQESATPTETTETISAHSSTYPTSTSSSSQATSPPLHADTPFLQSIVAGANSQPEGARESESGEAVPRNRPRHVSHTKPSMFGKKITLILYYNARSIVPKIDELRVTVQDTSPHVICIVESRLSDEIMDNELSIDHYQLVRLDRNRWRRCFNVCQ